MRVSLVLLILMISQALFGQDNSNPGQKVLDNSQIKHDLEVLTRAIESIHPNTYLFTSENNLDKSINSIIAKSENGLSVDAFHVNIRQYIRKIGCGHTLAIPSLDWYKYIKANSSMLPFTLYLLEEGAFINVAFDQDSLLQNQMQLLEIDGRNIEEIYADMCAIQERDGTTESFVHYKVQRLFTTYYLFLYGQKDRYMIKVKNLKGEIEEFEIKPGIFKSGKKEEKKALITELKNNDATFYIETTNPEIGILDINGFSNKGYKKFYKRVFEDIQERNIKHLVLDLRNNSGGYFPNGNNLMKYLLDSTFVMHFSKPKSGVKKPAEATIPFFGKMTNIMFNTMPDRDKEDPDRNYAIRNKPIEKYHYDGQLYVLLNHGSFSLGSYVSAMLKHHSDAILIGAETGGTEFGSNALIKYNITLPESGIRVIVPYYFLDHKIQSPDSYGNGVIPHVQINYSLADLISKTDKEMDKVKDILRKGDSY